MAIPEGRMLPEGTLAGRVAVVTGGGTGIGLGIAREFSRLGAPVVLASRKLENCEAAAEAVRAAGGNALAVRCDVRDPEQVDELIQAAVDRFGGVDIMVNNAAGNFVCPAEDLSTNGWNAVVNIVLNGGFYCSRAAGKQMIRQGRGGNILSIVATYAWTGGPGTIHSACAKAGVVTMMQTLGVEWARYGIRANSIAPGPIEGTGAAPALWPTPEAEAAVRDDVPLGRMGEVTEIARAAAFLVSDYGSYITGECLVVDGGGWLGKGMFTKTRPRA